MKTGQQSVHGGGEDCFKRFRRVAIKIGKHESDWGHTGSQNWNWVLGAVSPPLLPSLPDKETPTCLFSFFQIHSLRLALSGGSGGLSLFSVVLFPLALASLAQPM